MYELYRDLTPEETFSVSDHYLKISRRISGSSYVDDLSIRIEREKSILHRSIALARQNELAHLLAEADAQFVHALTLMQDLTEVKARVDTDPAEQESASAVSRVIHEYLIDSVFGSRGELLAAVEQMIQVLDSEELTVCTAKSGLTLVFNDLKLKFRIVYGLVKEWDEQSEEVPPPSVAGRRLAASLKDFHQHLAGYSRIGNREYRKLLGEIERLLAEKKLMAEKRLHAERQSHSESAAG